jgi:uncharacterized protein (TIGR02588 family)
VTERSSNGDPGDGKDGGRVRDGATPAEWAIGLLSTALVLLLLGYLTWNALSQPSRPPMIEMRARELHPMPSGGWLAVVEARNSGTATATSVSIRGELKRGASTVEESHVTLDFVPGGSTIEAGLYFRNDPRRYRLELRALGFERP